MYQTDTGKAFSLNFDLLAWAILFVKLYFDYKNLMLSFHYLFNCPN